MLTRDLTDRDTLAEIQQLTAEENVLLVIGGPPCQGYSLIGTRGRKAVESRDGVRFREIPENREYDAFLRVVEAVQPRFVVMENVPGLFAANGGRAREQIPSLYAKRPGCNRSRMTFSSAAPPRFVSCRVIPW